MRFRLEKKDTEIDTIRQELSACQRNKDQNYHKLTFDHERDLQMLKDDLGAAIERL